LHELLRQYAEERLDETPDDKESVQDLHSAFYADRLQQLEGKLKGAQVLAGLAAIETESDNIRVAWQWMVTYCNEEAIQKSLRSLILYYLMRSRRREGDLAFGLLSTCLDAEDNLLLVQVLVAQASFKISFDQAKFMERARRGLTIWRKLGCPSGAASIMGY